jgi:DNA-binding IclR family transcriptional regulator
MAEVRRAGHYARHADPLTGHAAVAAAVRDHRGGVVAGLCVGGPSHRIGRTRFERELVPATLRGAARISERLGFGTH